MVWGSLCFYLPIFHFDCLPFSKHPPEEYSIPIFPFHCLPFSEHPPKEYSIPIFPFHCYPFHCYPFHCYPFHCYPFHCSLLKKKEHYIQVNISLVDIGPKILDRILNSTHNPANIRQLEYTVFPYTFYLFVLNKNLMSFFLFIIFFLFISFLIFYFTSFFIFYFTSIFYLLLYPLYRSDYALFLFFYEHVI
jgi:hypothetical protein